MSVDLRLGDSMEWLTGLQADALISDPPYGISHRRGHTGQRGRGLGKHIETHIIGDDAPFDPTPLLLFPVVVLFGANHYANRLPANGSWTFWHKRPGMKENDFSDGEFIWDSTRHPTRYIQHMWNGVLRDSEVGQDCLHPTQKPVALMQQLIEKYTRPGDVIVDPYMGTGATGVAALKLGRSFIGGEISPGYFAIAQRRITDAQAQLPLPLFAQVSP